MRNFARINNYWNNIESRKDYRKQIARAREFSLTDLVQAGLTDEAIDSTSWRKLDKLTAKLREEIDRRQREWKDARRAEQFIEDNGK